MMITNSLHTALRRGLTVISLAAFSLVVLVGCAQTPAGIERYLLPSPADQQSSPESTAVTRTLLLRELRTAEFLDSEGLVLQLDAVSLNEAHNHRWAEPLPLQLRRQLRLGLQQQLGGLLLIDSDPGRRADLQLQMEVDAFHGSYDGQALVAGRWLLLRPEGELVTARDFNVRVPLDDAGYPALVHALSRGWDSVTGDIAEALSELDKL
jgi:uncharacterized lipoprotein YmbA